MLSLRAPPIGRGRATRLYIVIVERHVYPELLSDAKQMAPSLELRLKTVQSISMLSKCIYKLGSVRSVTDTTTDVSSARRGLFANFLAKSLFSFGCKTVA